MGFEAEGEAMSGSLPPNKKNAAPEAEDAANAAVREDAAREGQGARTCEEANAFLPPSTPPLLTLIQGEAPLHMLDDKHGTSSGKAEGPRGVSGDEDGGENDEKAGQERIQGKEREGKGLGGVPRGPRQRQEEKAWRQVREPTSRRSFDRRSGCVVEHPSSAHGASAAHLFPSDFTSASGLQALVLAADMAPYLDDPMSAHRPDSSEKHAQGGQTESSPAIVQPSHSEVAGRQDNEGEPPQAPRPDEHMQPQPERRRPRPVFADPPSHGQAEEPAAATPLNNSPWGMHMRLEDLLCNEEDVLPDIPKPNSSTLQLQLQQFLKTPQQQPQQHGQHHQPSQLSPLTRQRRSLRGSSSSSPPFFIDPSMWTSADAFADTNDADNGTATARRRALRSRSPDAFNSATMLDQTAESPLTSQVFLPPQEDARTDSTMQPLHPVPSATAHEQVRGACFAAQPGMVAAQERALAAPTATTATATTATASATTSGSDAACRDSAEHAMGLLTGSDSGGRSSRRIGTTRECLGREGGTGRGAGRGMLGSFRVRERNEQEGDGAMNDERSAAAMRADVVAAQERRQGVQQQSQQPEQQEQQEQPYDNNDQATNLLQRQHPARSHLAVHRDRGSEGKGEAPDRGQRDAMKTPLQARPTDSPPSQQQQQQQQQHHHHHHHQQQQQQLEETHEMVRRGFESMTQHRPSTLSRSRQRGGSSSSSSDFLSSIFLNASEAWDVLSPSSPGTYMRLHPPRSRFSSSGSDHDHHLRTVLSAGLTPLAGRPDPEAFSDNHRNANSGVAADARAAAQNDRSSAQGGDNDAHGVDEAPLSPLSPLLPLTPSAMMGSLSDPPLPALMPPLVFGASGRSGGGTGAADGNEGEEGEEADVEWWENGEDARARAGDAGKQEAGDDKRRKGKREKRKGGDGRTAQQEAFVAVPAATQAVHWERKDRSEDEPPHPKHAKQQQQQQQPQQQPPQQQQRRQQPQQERCDATGAPASKQAKVTHPMSTPPSHPLLPAVPSGTAAAAATAHVQAASTPIWSSSLRVVEGRRLPEVGGKGRGRDRGGKHRRQSRRSKHRGKEKRKEETKQYTCEFPECNMMFASHNSWRYHMRGHTGETPHACWHCKMAFRDKASLKRHVKTHSGEKPFACSAPGCDKRFTRREHLRRHVQTHRPRPYKCPLDDCSRGFSTFDAYANHMRRHERSSGRSVGTCPRKGCGLKFPTLEALAVHSEHHITHDKELLAKSNKKQKRRSSHTTRPPALLTNATSTARQSSSGVGSGGSGGSGNLHNSGGAQERGTGKIGNQATGSVAVHSTNAGDGGNSNSNSNSNNSTAVHVRPMTTSQQSGHMEVPSIVSCIGRNSARAPEPGATPPFAPSSPHAHGLPLCIEGLPSRRHSCASSEPFSFGPPASPLITAEPLLACGSGPTPHTADAVAFKPQPPVPAQVNPRTTTDACVRRTHGHGRGAYAGDGHWPASAIPADVLSLASASSFSSTSSSSSLASASSNHTSGTGPAPSTVGSHLMSSSARSPSAFS